MTLLLAFVASLIFEVSSRRPSRSVIDEGSVPWCGEAIPGHMIRTTATVAFHRGESRRIERASWGRRAGSESGGSTVRASPSNVTKSSTIIALLITVLLLNPQTRALGLNMTNPATRITLLRGNGTRRGARGRLVAGLTAIVAKSLVRCATLGDVTKVATLETALPGKLKRHSQNTSHFSHCQLSTNSLPPSVKRGFVEV